MADARYRRLMEIFQTLPDEQADQILDYAEFLAQRYVGSKEVPEPENISRPEDETVIEAIKRLSATYPMLDRQKLLHETGEFVTQHLLQGRSTTEVIDDLEALFQNHYQALLNKNL